IWFYSKSLGKADFLLIAAREFLSRLFNAGALDLQGLDIFLSDLPDGPVISPFDESAQERSEKLVLHLHRSERDIPVQRLFHKQANAAPVFRHECHAGCQGGCRIVQVDWLPMQGDCSSCGAKSHNAIWNTKFSLPSESSDAKDLSFVNLKTDVSDCLSRHVDPQMLDGQDRFLLCVIRCSGTCLRIHTTTHHEFRDLTDVGVVGSYLFHDLSVPQNNDPVADVEDLLKAVCYEDNGDSSGSQSAK